MRNHFSYDLSKAEKEFYLHQHPFLSKDKDGHLMRRTWICVQKIRKNVDGQEQTDGCTCEAGYSLIRDDVIALSLIATVGCAVIKWLRNHR